MERVAKGFLIEVKPETKTEIETTGGEAPAGSQTKGCVIAHTTAAVITPLDVVRDIMLCGRHSRHTIARGGVSLPTADRWIKLIAETLPGAKRIRVCKTAWLEWSWSAPKAVK